MKVLLRKSDYNRILEHALKERPNEACGLLGGIDEGEGDDKIRRIEKVYLLTNIDHSNEHFSIDPKEQISAVKDMRSNGLKPVGNWHSHPESPSRSSKEDIRLAYDKNASYFIISLMDENRPVLNSFHVENGSSVAEDLEIV